MAKQGDWDGDIKLTDMALESSAATCFVLIYMGMSSRWPA